MGTIAKMCGCNNKQENLEYKLVTNSLFSKLQENDRPNKGYETSNSFGSIYIVRRQMVAAPSTQQMKKKE